MSDIQENYKDYRISYKILRRDYAEFFTIYNRRYLGIFFKISAEMRGLNKTKPVPDFFYWNVRIS